jgi:undecaprenyl diphosphate synthase
MPTMPALDSRDVLGLEPEALPRHIAIIMDGNGRWAQKRSLPRIEGHRHAIPAVRETVRQCARLGIECLTLYSFSVDNWRRPQSEIDGLMALYAKYLREERQEIMDNDVRMIQVGRRDGLPESVLKELDVTRDMSAKNNGLVLALALNYGSRTEIVDAVRNIAQRVRDGALQPNDIDEALLSDSMYTAGLPDPDLMIRTGGEMRISNFLLWQMSYTELFVSSVLWPDFQPPTLYEAILAFANRERRFGDVEAHGPSKPHKPT